MEADLDFGLDEDYNVPSQSHPPSTSPSTNPLTNSCAKDNKWRTYASDLKIQEIAELKILFKDSKYTIEKQMEYIQATLERCKLAENILNYENLRKNFTNLQNKIQSLKSVIATTKERQAAMEIVSADDKQEVLNYINKLKPQLFKNKIIKKDQPLVREIKAPFGRGLKKFLPDMRFSVLPLCQRCFFLGHREQNCKH